MGRTLSFFGRRRRTAVKLKDLSDDGFWITLWIAEEGQLGGEMQAAARNMRSRVPPWTLLPAGTSRQMLKEEVLKISTPLFVEQYGEGEIFKISRLRFLDVEEEVI